MTFKLVITCDDWLETLWCEGSIQQVYADFGLDTERLFEFMRKSADVDGVFLSDVAVWDYDKAIYACWRS